MATHSLAAALSMFLVATTATAQCTTQWLPGSSLTNGTINALAVTANGDVIAGGAFTQIEGVAANRIARWDGSTWQPLGSGSSTTVFAICVLKNGEVVASGNFTAAGGIPVAGIARWNGAAWSALGGSWLPPGGTGQIRSIFERADGSIAVGGLFLPPATISYPFLRAATWDGAAWTELPLPLVPGCVNALTEDTNGDLLLGGFQGLVGVVLRWNGSAVQAVASTSGSGVVHGFAWRGGELVASGDFTSIGGVAALRIAQWNGSTWSPFGTGLTAGPGRPAYSMVVLPDGDVVTVGMFTGAGGSPAGGIARWDGAAWSTFGTGLTGGYGVAALAFSPSGPLFVGGEFTSANGTPCVNLARLDTPCHATSSTFGYGCGTNSLAVTSPAWANGMFRATGTGLPTNSIVLTVTGLTAQMLGLGMDAVFAIGIPGCDLFVASDILGLAFTTNGTATSEFYLPDSPPIVGVTFYHQMIPWEITDGIFTTITATNALQLTAGAF